MIKKLKVIRLLIVAYVRYVVIKTIVRLIKELTAGVNQKHLRSSYFPYCQMTDKRHVFVKIVSGHLLMQILMKPRGGFMAPI